MRYVIFVFAVVLSFCRSFVAADVCGKVDVGPAWLHIDVLESGKTIQKLNMIAVKADSTIVVWKGLCFKPSLLFGKDGYSQIGSAALGIGHYTPITEKIAVTPSVGLTYTRFRTKLEFEHPLLPISFKLKEHFCSISPYIALDLCYNFTDSWRIIGFVQYSWARTHTTIEQFGSSVSHPQGPNFALLLEHDINESWSVNVGGAYNTSLTREKHGLRAYGARLAIAYWF